MEFILKNKKLFALTFWVWITLIISFSIIPNGPKMQIEIKGNMHRLDYIIHFLVYFSLAILYLLWKADNYFNMNSKHLIYFLIGGLLLSGLSEYAQSFIPERTFNPFDFYSNMSGLIIGVIIPRLVLSKIV
jgi:VanZ family protein